VSGMRKALIGSAILVALAIMATPGYAAFPGENGKIAFVRHAQSCNGCESHLVTMNPSGSGQVDIGLGKTPAWSSDGLKLAFADGFGVQVSNPDGTGVTTVLNWGLNVGAVTWAPDGTKLAAALYTCPANPCGHHIYTFNLDGTGLVDLTPALADSIDPAWSPDGSKIAFASGPGPDENDHAVYRLYTIEAAGPGPLSVLTNTPASDRNPNWSPDGTQIAFTRETANRSDIYRMNADGSAQTNLTAVQVRYRDSPAWSPDGTQIALYGEPCGAIDLIDLNSGQETDCVSHPPPGQSDFDLDWQPLAPGVAGYPRPRGATPFLAYLVPAYAQCSTSNASHGAPLAFPSCRPPAPSSTALTLGTPDANGASARARSSLRLTAFPGNATTSTDEADVELLLRSSDVRRAGTLADYTGELSLVLSLRITDKANLPGPAAATGDVAISAAVPCVATSDTLQGSDCDLDTTIDSLVGGNAVQERGRAIWELGQVRLYDGGPDGDAGTDPNALFEAQGLFVP
jgi:hypothetical protein